MKKILVTGAGGQLGRELQRLNQPWDFATREQLPIDDRNAIRSYFQRYRPDWCINCAAYTAVDKAESDREAAYRINGDAAGYLAHACRETGARLIHLSTDYVFGGNASSPLKESDPTAPINVYGASKLEGELNARANHPGGTLIIRTSWVYSEYGNNFVRTMIQLMSQRASINVVDDQIGSPTYAADLASAILQILSNPNFFPGTYHYSNEGEISWYEFALAIRDGIKSNCTVHPIPTSEFPTPAKRPAWSVLDKTLIRDTYKVQIPAWHDSLAVCLDRLQPR